MEKEIKNKNSINFKFEFLQQNQGFIDVVRKREQFSQSLRDSKKK
jgi:hypothetical protein